MDVYQNMDVYRVSHICSEFQIFEHFDYIKEYSQHTQPDQWGWSGMDVWKSETNLLQYSAGVGRADWLQGWESGLPVHLEVMINSRPIYSSRVELLADCGTFYKH